MDVEAHGLFGRVAMDVVRIAGAVGFAQLLVFAAAPLVTRLYTADAFGRFALFSAVVPLLYPLATLNYAEALPLPAEESRAVDLLALCLMLLVGSSLALAFLSLLMSPILVAWLHIRAWEIMLLPLAIFAVALQGTLSWWLVRAGAFSQVARVRFTTTIGTVALQISFGQLYAGSTSLILSLVGGYLLGSALMVRKCRRVLSDGFARISLSGIRCVAAEYRAFAMVSAPSRLITAVGPQLPTALLPLLYGLSVTGQYALAQRVLYQPTVLVCHTVNQVFCGNAAKLLSKEPAYLWTLFRRVNLYLLAIMAPCFVLTWFGVEIFAFLFGTAWGQAGAFAGIMIVATFLEIPAEGTQALDIYRLNHWMSAWRLLRLILLVAALGVAWRIPLSPTTCVLAITAALAVSNALLLGVNALAVWRIKLCAEQRASGSSAEELA